MIVSQLTSGMMANAASPVSVSGRAPCSTHYHLSFQSEPFRWAWRDSHCGLDHHFFQGEEATRKTSAVNLKVPTSTAMSWMIRENAEDQGSSSSGGKQGCYQRLLEESAEGLALGYVGHFSRQLFFHSDWLVPCGAKHPFITTITTRFGFQPYVFENNSKILWHVLY